MYIALNTKSKCLGGTSDLTLLAPIRRGLVPALDSITYKSRVRRLMEVLQLLRQASHEYLPFRPISDSAERVGVIHSFRVAIVEPEDKLLLAVTFDGGREAYVRVLWQKIGTLLDLLFCNTSGHVPSYGGNLADWDAWIEGVQIKTDFFYSRPRLMADDVVFLQEEERARRGAGTPAEADLASVRRTEATAEMRAWALATHPTPRAFGETARQGVNTIALLHRLTAWFVPGTPDGDFLHRAARDLLPEFAELASRPGPIGQALDVGRQRYREAIDWFVRPYEARALRPLPTAAPGEALRRAIQGGILEPYAQVTHGALLLLAFRPDARSSGFWRAMRERCVSAHEQPADGRTVWNVALTHDGLRAAGLTEAELAAFPLEFRQGMEARNGVLGDLWINHPDRWRRPRHRHTGQPIEIGAVHAVVQLRCGQACGMPTSAREYDLDDPRHPLQPDIARLLQGLEGVVDLLAQQPMVRHLRDPGDPGSEVVEHFGYADGGSDPEFDPARLGSVYRHNLVHAGEVLVGLENAADPDADGAAGDDPDVGTDAEAYADAGAQMSCRGSDSGTGSAPGTGTGTGTGTRTRAGSGSDPAAFSSWLRLGSFLVLRKLSQDVASFDEVLTNGVAATGLDRELLAAKLVGRGRDGDPLTTPGAVNDFVYDADPAGSRCPLHAHIRRANPRLPPGAERPATLAGLPQAPVGARAPRILRRSMSFGPRHVADALDQAAARPGLPAASAVEAPRGLCFMAYNARIGEQFEVIQRWLAGGNSTGGCSGRSDPLIGVAAPGERRVYAFEHPGVGGTPQVHRLALDGNADPTVVAEPLVRLEWGAYLFTPSLAALADLEERAERRAGARGPGDWPWSADRGRAAIERLQTMDGELGDRVAAWKAALEDPEALKDHSAASIWAAIRRDFDGVLRTPCGVLAASHRHAFAVLSDPAHRYSVDGYRERAAPTLGDLYLGLDDRGPGCPYRRAATAPNQAIHREIDEQQAFAASRALARASIDKLIGREIGIARAVGEPTWQLQFAADEVGDDVLGALCRQWFGLPDAGPFMLAGRFRWDWLPGMPVPYPGHFLSPSRYIFQPQPGAEVARLGTLHGTAVNAAFRAWVAAMRDAGRLPTAPDGQPAPLGVALFQAVPRPPGGTAQDAADADERLAVILLGALIGFLPTVAGNLRQSLNEWLLDGSFWTLRAGLHAGPPGSGALKPAIVAAPMAVAATATPPDGPALVEPSPLAAPTPAALATVRTALQRSMMLRPSPEVVWRRANCDHALGPVTVRAGETVVAAIVSATHEQLERGETDEGMVFGGWRGSWPAGASRPTHACPGHAMAMGTLCGILTGLLEHPEALRPTGFPLSLRMEGDLPAATPALH